MKYIKIFIFLLVISFIVLLGLRLLDSNPQQVNDARYHGVKYEGTGKTETYVDVVIQSDSGILYIGKVRIVDDAPTVWKALQGIVEHVENISVIEKDEEGKVVKINDLENNRLLNWTLLIDNVITDIHVEDTDILTDYNGQSITLSYEKR